MIVMIFIGGLGVVRSQVFDQVCIVAQRGRFLRTMNCCYADWLCFVDFWICSVLLLVVSNSCCAKNFDWTIFN